MLGFDTESCLVEVVLPGVLMFNEEALGASVVAF